MSWPWNNVPLRVATLAGLPLVVALLLPWAPAGESAGTPPADLAPPERVSASEEATPDCDIPPPAAFPARQRQEHLGRLGADRWQAAGYRGRGIKIAVLDTGFRGYRAHLGTALPAHVTVCSCRSDGNLEARDSQHGILCSEVLHALAPEADLLLANWDPDRPDGFLAAVRWARRQGARVISCSVIMPSWSDGEGGGAVDQGLAELVGPGDGRGDMLFFASAGNTAQRHWRGRFHDGGAGFHEWRPGHTGNRLFPWFTQPISVELYGGSAARYELSVRNADTGALVGRCRSQGGMTGRCYAVVRVTPRTYAPYEIRVRLVEGQGDDFHLVVLGGTLACATAQGSISCPADGPAVIAVGAVDSRGQRAAYSSCGPNSRQPKPDFVAPVPFPSLWRPRPFTGTSAAAPQAAGLAALCWSRHPDWAAAQVRTALRASAEDLGPPGHDFETGYGLIHMPQADFVDRRRTSHLLLHP
ncbi:MAG TPA: S8 family serine peptidase [Gemmataceae bacterium]|nr:S8 family serine peptidase [Gemmataceae bacterium]